MSQKDRIEIQRLYEAIERLAARVSALEADGKEQIHDTGFRAKHFGFGRWRVVNFEGVATGDQWLEEADARGQAAEMNAALEGMEAA